MGQGQSNIPQNNLVVWLHLQNHEKLKKLIEQRLNDKSFTIDKRINQMDDTLLHYAAFKRDKILIQYLLSKGASPNCKNSRNLTPADVTDDLDIKQMLETK